MAWVLSDMRHILRMQGQADHDSDERDEDDAFHVRSFS